MTGNIYLTGFMGAGKTTIGRLLAEVLNRRFVDLDARLEAQFGRPIPSVFADLGEEAFRRKESRLLKDLAQRRRLVVAAGGGAVKDEENRRLMRRSGEVVYLEADLETCLSRLTAQDLAARPLWQDLEAVGRLLEERRPCYLDCDLVLPAGDRDPDQTAQEIVAQLLPEQGLTVRLDRAECPVRATFNAPAVLAEFVHNRRGVVLTDQRVGRLHLKRYRPHLGDWPVISIRGGERAKSLAVAQRLYQRLLDERIERGDLLIALGGGVITDLGAFVAATYKRGLDFVLVATSLLGCVDAAVGGKAAINLPPAKNAVGCFTSPTGVVLDISALRTLQTKQIREGLTEAYKTGLVASPPLVELIERQR
ncbi:MAG: iron-containing alcohol dehydrogenase, partial [Deltaproteobacteria bacterium]|nr:iron-containing alcohol dehydrogenase [Deltaproteobacteria bacterium]